MKHQIRPIDEIRKRYSPIQNINRKHREKLTFLERMAIWITNHVGSMGFFIVIFCWTIFWLSWNTLAPVHLRFDPSPAFVLWLFISSMIQIFLMPLIMVGQNLQSKHSELRADQDFAINKKAETEIETIIKHLENQHEMIAAILERLDRSEGKRTS